MKESEKQKRKMRVFFFPPLQNKNNVSRNHSGKMKEREKSGRMVKPKMTRMYIYQWPEPLFFFFSFGGPKKSTAR